MTRHTFTLGAVVAAFILSQAPAFGQAGSRPNTTGSSSGTAAPRGGDTGSSGSSTSSSGSSTSSSGSGSSVSGAGTASSRPSGGSTGGDGMSVARERAPQRPMAVPRGGAMTGNTEMGAGAPTTRMTPAEAGARAVPTYSRPRDGRAALGDAIDRRDAPPRPGGSTVFYPYYSNYGYYGPYGGYPYYGYGYSYGYGVGYGFGLFGYDPFFLGGTYYGAPSYSAGGYSSQHRGIGKLRLRVQPAHAEVYVDGYFVGTVDDFNGLFQRLNVDAGAHRIELRAPGYETVEFEVFITDRETITYRGEMKPVIP
jgi:hypothetical protein